VESNKVLYFYTSWSTFVAKDVEILKSLYSVILFEFKPVKKSHTPFWFIKQCIFMFRHLWGAKLVVSQFGGYHSFLPAVFSKFLAIPSLLVAGGTDCVAFPSISYGNLRKNTLGHFTKWSHQLSNMVSPVDDTLVFYDYSYKNTGTVHPCQGIKAHIPNFNTPFEVIHNGYEDISKGDPFVKTPNTYITIAAGIEQESRYKLKGVDLFVDLAKQLPGSNFTIIGAKTIPEDLPKNVTLIPFVPNNELVQYLRACQFYVQLSLSEGFPNALCEAMICGCVPVISNVGAMPKIVEQNGVIVLSKSVTEIKEGIKKLDQNTLIKMGDSARKSILTRFPLDQRKKQLLILVNKLITKQA